MNPVEKEKFKRGLSRSNNHKHGKAYRLGKAAEKEPDMAFSNGTTVTIVPQQLRIISTCTSSLTAEGYTLGGGDSY